MKVAIDTNVLVRAVVRHTDASSDDMEQSIRARALMLDADSIFVGTEMLCEFVWVLRRSYKVPTHTIGDTMRALCSASKVICDQPAAEAGLAMMDAGGDFADGIIAHQGYAHGADTFVSFDRAAIRRLQQLTLNARNL